MYVESWQVPWMCLPSVESHYPTLLILSTTAGEGFSLEAAHRLQMESQRRNPGVGGGVEGGGSCEEYKVFG